MDKVLNFLPNTNKSLDKMNKVEFNKWLVNSDLTKSRKRYKINVLEQDELLDTTHGLRKTEAYVLPLSLEDNSTISGTAAILKEFESEFDLHSGGTSPEFIPFNTTNCSFDVDQARSRYKHMISQAKHVADMAGYEATLASKEMHLDGIMSDETPVSDSNIRTGEEESDGSDGKTETIENSVANDRSCTLDSERRRFRNEDAKFWQYYNNIDSRVKSSIQSNSEEQFAETVNAMTKAKLYIHKDHLQRTFLHIAIEKANNTLAKALVFSGFNVNTKEGCGITPLHLTITFGNISMAQFLIDRNAQFNGPMFSSIPSPKTMAEKLHLTELLRIMEEKEEESEEEDDTIASIDHRFNLKPLISSTEETDKLVGESKGLSLT
ncbi:ankyrin repeat domain-containing [Paramuricea clavata]|uniref:Ankyrin repeat domain-containing n=1 Tax=Paramuricea clavata TaxID=317549 RepID=A0A6S7JKD1_PARCT|nr:ankyrin repeat domain-containing [Paramuricea clavata]